jgi:hypothetical protein
MSTMMQLQSRSVIIGVAAGMLVALSVAAAYVRNGATGEYGAPPVPKGTYGHCRFAFAILGESESRWWCGKAELYLKIESTLHPDLNIRVPVNVGGQFFGRISGVASLPFSHSGSMDETDLIELLDEDGLSPDEVESLSDLAGEAGYLVWQGMEAYALKAGAVFLPSMSATAKNLV